MKKEWLDDLNHDIRNALQGMRQLVREAGWHKEDKERYQRFVEHAMRMVNALDRLWGRFHGFIKDDGQEEGKEREGAGA